MKVCARVVIGLGIVMASLASAAPPADYGLLDPVRAGTRLLRAGNTGSAVTALQHALGAAGEPVVADATFGTATSAAVRRFQARNRCAVDGVVGPQTMRALDRVLGWPITPALVPSIPARDPRAPTGSEFLAATSGLSRAARELAIQAELEAGNVPAFLRAFVPLSATSGGRTVVVRVMPDYLAIGADHDFVRIPMGLVTAQQVAARFGCRLPTTRVVDLAWQQAGVRLAPLPMSPTAQMMSNGYYAEHQRRIEAQLVGQPRGLLVAGHKKDLVLSNRLLAAPGRVAIYGWHQPNGRPIQPLSTVHEASYADYSHGVRLVSREVLLDGRPVALDDLLRDPSLAPLLSAEGPIRPPLIP